MKRAEVVTLDSLSIIGSERTDAEGCPSTPRIRHLNEDGEYEWASYWILNSGRYLLSCPLKNL